MINDIINYLPKGEEITDIVPLYLIGNKIDLLEERVISEEEGKELANRYPFKYFEVSAKTCCGLYEAMEFIILDYYKKSIILRSINGEIDKNENKIKYKNEDNSENKNKIYQNIKNQKNCIIF